MAPVVPGFFHWAPCAGGADVRVRVVMSAAIGC